MSTMFNENWLRSGAVIECTVMNMGAALAEIVRLRRELGEQRDANLLLLEDAERDKRAKAELLAANSEQGAALYDARTQLKQLDELVNSPEIEDFLKGVRLEAAHQRLRWGDSHDRSKSAENWYWLVGYLASKACRANIEGDRTKALHHTISTAAALLHWHASIKEDDSGVGVGDDIDLEDLMRRFGYGPITVYRCYSIGDTGTEYFVATNLDELRDYLAARDEPPEWIGATEVPLQERVIAGPGTDRTCTILEAIAQRLLSGDMPPFQLVSRFA